MLRDRYNREALGAQAGGVHWQIQPGLKSRLSEEPRRYRFSSCVRLRNGKRKLLKSQARVAKSVDARDLKSLFRQRECGFESHPGYQAACACSGDSYPIHGHGSFRRSRIARGVFCTGVNQC